MRYLVLIMVVLGLMSGCMPQYTNCTFTTVRLDSGGEMTAEVRQVPLDKSTSGSVTATKTDTVSPTATVTGIPGM